MLQERLLTAYYMASGEQLDISLALLDTEELVALSPTRGTILISKGMIRRVGTEGELAFIIAHEIAHSALGHILTSESDRKNAEIEADHFGVSLMASAGYDPGLARISLLNTYGMTSFKDPRYPSMEERVRNIEEIIADSGWTPPGTIDRREFRKFRDQLLAPKR